MIMRPGRRQRGCRPEAQRARHAQMQQQPAAGAQRQPQVLAAPLHRADRRARQRQRIDAQRPAQGLAQTDLAHPRALEAIDQTETGDFDFRQFRHARNYRSVAGPANAAA